MSTLGLSSFYRSRDATADELTRELFGPAHDQEPTSTEQVLVDPPITRYLAGVLYPQVPDADNADEDNDLGLGQDRGKDLDESDSEPVAHANVRYPSSFGLTFAVDTKVTTAIVVEAWAAKYRPFTPEGQGASEDAGEDGQQEHTTDDEDESAGRENLRDHHWRREQLANEPIEIDISSSLIDYRREVSPGLELFGVVRPPDKDGYTNVTIGLINTNQAVGRGPRDEISFFQPEIEVRGSEASCFVARSGASTERNAEDQDVRSYQLLFRHADEFAGGHGCSATWESEDGSSGRASVIRSTFVPRHELLLTDSNPNITSDWFSMKRLAESDRSAVRAGLEDFCGRYEEWITSLEAQKETLDAGLSDIADRHIGFCATAAERMRSGVAFLAEDDDAWRSFQLANRAMFEQRCRAEWIRTGADGDEPPRPDEHFWRPFQLAFILLSLKGITDTGCEDRDVLDLLWFPTGGGKTEAYLGLIAYTIFLRRLRTPEGGSGLTVLMRYTLRLLTLQQFERATSLICACEALRRQHTDELGLDMISIGLWVGAAATPNTRKDASKSLDQLRTGAVITEKNPVQLRRCSWCGTGLDHRNYWIADRQRPPAMVVSCRKEGCEFEKKLPVFLVDEDIYSHKPSLLIGTVDKFASLPWKEDTATLFNLDGPGLPPQLIIQDELHLITGPLGTLTGLYETAIDMLCEANDGSHPKIIASTATIRRASDQVRGIFNRSVAQFPPPGLDSRDSWFAVEMPKTDKGSRLYLGAIAPGTSHATLMVRSYSSLLQSACSLGGSDDALDGIMETERTSLDQRAEDTDEVVAESAKSRREQLDRIDSENLTDQVRSLQDYDFTSTEAAERFEVLLTHSDPYWTLLGYFNSLRVLGGARLQVHNDIPAHMEVIAGRSGRQARRIEQVIELTSRSSSAEIPAHLAAMDRRLGSGPVAPLDVVLATNMISVGVDIDRLGLMAVMGQPQSSSEYIQATSRVGRRHPGLVAILFNAARSRDLSHYERFMAFHSALYREVNPSSVTPFSARARDKGLHAVFVALCRLTVPGLRSNKNASSVADHDPELRRIRDRIIDRVTSVAPGEANETLVHLNQIIADWKKRAMDNPDLVYNNFPRGNSDSEPGLLVESAEHDPEEGSFPTLWSLRDVDTQSNLYALRASHRG